MSSIAIVSKLPDCDFEHDTPVVARYDFRTTTGQWANGCRADYIKWRLHSSLGTGKGQFLRTEDEAKGFDEDEGEVPE